MRLLRCVTCEKVWPEPYWFAFGGRTPDLFSGIWMNGPRRHLREITADAGEASYTLPS